MGHLRHQTPAKTPGLRCTTLSFSFARERKRNSEPRKHSLSVAGLLSKLSLRLRISMSLLFGFERDLFSEKRANPSAIGHRYFQSSNGSAGNSSQTTALNKLFDRYRDSPVDNPDTIGVEGSMRYMADLQVDLDEVATLAVAEALSAPTMGEFTREGFVLGWRSLE
ncbi:MAG: Scaffold-type E3 ligase [Pleopsidium flavum]|nr:MAG: Scaffold-type E3 ligase [Pleopsidium flavum]